MNGSVRLGCTDSTGLAAVPVRKMLRWSPGCIGGSDNGAGAAMRVRLIGYDAADLEALSRGFWGAR